MKISAWWSWVSGHNSVKAKDGTWNTKANALTPKAKDKATAEDVVLKAIKHVKAVSLKAKAKNQGTTSTSLANQTQVLMLWAECEFVCQ